MKRLYFFTILFALTSVCFAQLTETFSDGNFTSNPVWSGSVTQFIVNSTGQLQLNASAAGKAYLSTPVAAQSLNNFEWQVYLKLSFAPSANNYARYYLISDQADLTQPLNGYYMQFGEAGNADAVELFRQSGTTSTSVCRGTNGTIAAAFGVRVKVTRNNAGIWKIFTDYTGGSNFIAEAGGTDVAFSSGAFAGLVTVVTQSNITKVIADDFFITAPVVDTTPPSVVSVNATNAQTIIVTFSERVEKLSAEAATNYSVSNSIGQPTTAVLQSDSLHVQLTLTSPLANGHSYQLTITNVADLSGNILKTTTVDFLYFVPTPVNPKDIILTEIFADPSPQVGLPAQEFVEIYNRSEAPFDLSNWKFSDGTSVATFPKQIILPKEYWIVCASANSSLFTTYGNVLGVSNFPTLNNSGDNLTLRNSDGTTIDSVNYALAWYHDPDKQEGGWSLEVIDVNNPCGDIDNWTASEDPSGGTPGRQNLVNASKPDLTGPRLLAVALLSSHQLQLSFDEPLEKKLTAVEVTLDPPIAIAQVQYPDNAHRTLLVTLLDTLAFRQRYTINVSNLTDCSGNFIQSDFSQLSFARPEIADSLDIVINEILFNPRTGGVDFVEVYNASPKYIDLSNWRIANFENHSPIHAVTITTDNVMLPPGGYLAFTSDPTILATQYPQAVALHLFETSLPSLPDDAGTVSIVSSQNLVIDHFSYSAAMHSPFVKDNEGVSLERISSSAITNDESNWRSANASAGFATPGFQNSNRRAEAPGGDPISIQPTVFSPARPGQDFSQINYRFAQSGLAATVKVLDAEGRTIKTIANNETIGLDGFFRWDGDRDDGALSRSGYYVIWFEVFDAGGNLNIYRKRVVIGR